jgi:uncharacterized protein (TIGR00661 family)
MARILYGVAGEGMGHAIRSRVIIDHLSREHDVQVVVSGRAHDYLKAREHDHLGVKKIWGLTIVYEDNTVRNVRTVLSNLRHGVFGGVPTNVRAYFQLVEAFRPEVVVTDFETWSAIFARRHRLPCISVDNIQVLNRCHQPPEIVRGKRTAYLVGKALVKAKVGFCFHYLVSTFFYPKIVKPRTTLHPPAFRPEILAAKPERGDHLVVYQTSTSNAELPAILARSGVECRIYGLRRDLAGDLREGNLVHRPFSERTFVEDLRTARGVVSGGSFTLMSEAVFLGKPVLSVPVQRQFEQIMNARWLQRLGYGMEADHITAARLGEFLERVPELTRTLAGYRQEGNADLLGSLDRVIARALAGRHPREPGEDPALAGPPS